MSTTVTLASTLAAILTISAWVAAIAHAQSASGAVSSPTAANGDLKPGVTISAANADQYAKYLPAAAEFALRHGFTIRVMPEHHVEWSEGFRHATEKYSPQVALREDDTIENYIAGMPFPLVDPADPKAAVKIAYNWHMGPFMPDDFSLAPWSSNGYSTDSSDPSKIIPQHDADYVCEQFDMLRLAHRTEVNPRPTLGETGAEWKAKCMNFSQFSGTAGEGAGMWIRYLDPHRPDEFYGFSEETRRVRRSAVNLEYPNEGCRGCHQPYWAYALPKTEIYKYRLLGTTTILACLAASDEPAGIKLSSDSIALGEEPFEPRNAYILEMTPLSPEALARRTIVYVDSEIYVWLAAEFYDLSELTAVAMPLWRMHPSPEGGNLFDLAGNFYHPAGNASFFRSLVPAHTEFTQTINGGQLSESAFVPSMLVR